MIICALDSCSAAGSAAVLQDGALLHEAFAKEGLTHSETLLVRCDESFRAAGLTPADADLFAVTSGPGSFTGLRIGMGLIKGLAFPKNVPCVPVPTFEALAEALRERDGDLLTVLDARQKRVYYAAFRVKDGVIERLCEDGLLPLTELAGRCAELGLDKPLAVGEMAEAAAAAVPGCEACEERFRDVRAGMVGRAALRLFREGKACSAAALTPFYLQPSQAERTRKENEEKQT